MRSTPTTPGGLRRYDQLHPAEAVVRAWREPGEAPAWHDSVKREIRRLAPLLGRSLDRLVRHQDRAQVTRLATESVAGTLLSFQPLTVDPDGTGGASFEDPAPAERWRRATIIVEELSRVGLI
jgi:hypothetical protein